MRSAEPTIEPEDIVREVNQYIESSHRSARESSNVTLLDSGQVFSLHRLAASIYAQGYRAGERSEAARHDGERQREFDQRRIDRQIIDVVRSVLKTLGWESDGDPDHDGQGVAMALQSAKSNYDSAVIARERLDLARDAIEAIGYFTEGEVDDDVAPRITELWSAVIPVLSLAGDLITQVEGAVGREAVLREHHVNAYMVTLIDQATAEHRANAIEDDSDG